MWILKRGLLIAALVVVLAVSGGGLFMARRGNPGRETGVQLPVEFIRERITVDIDPGWVTVTGVYWFRCNNALGGNFGIRYPFPVDEHHMFPDSVAVFHAGGEMISHTENRDANAVDFAVDMRVHPEFTVVYRQRITGSDARYILTTTSAWKKPLERAVYIVSLPEEFIPESFSLTPDFSRRIGGRRVYTVTRTNFLPDRDLTVSWKSAKRGERRKP